MRTCVYIDGYNLYYGCLKGTPYKWLNLVDLFQNHIIPRTPTFNSSFCDDIDVKYFTAPIDGKAASDANSVNDQRSYHAALRNVCESQLSIIEGLYSVTQTKAYQIAYDADGKELAPKDCEKVAVWKLDPLIHEILYC